MENPNPAHESLDQKVCASVEKMKSLTNQTIHKAEVYARRSPGKAVAWSVAAGFVIPRLPIALLLGIIGRLILCLIRPVILILGIAKICELTGCCCCKDDKKTS